ncbi:histone-lysine N-methyltransferase ATXR6 [Cucumis melo var. makuwa]|uniref:Histone-lysine N-methyltransferase ATXR6 n=1 Tax=Cucumis melo var. makuwa TaxID=1194695 RepID=A0A5A7TGK1_CUCMM|nr:histone-lysine N-methyltransferase ATXR6 [Cucumis melo var. makuwa]
MIHKRRTLAPKPSSPHHFLPDHDDYDDIFCQKCGSGDSPADLLLCDKCDRGYHLFCLTPILPSVPKGSWFCSTCSNHKKLKSFPLVQTKIVDFFRIQRPADSKKDSSLENRKKRRRAGSLVLSKKRRKLLPFNPTADPARRLEQMASLATALTATGTDFSNELTYVRGMAPRSANCASLEHGGMQVLPKEDVETLNLCRSMMERGEWPPLMVVFDPREGYVNLHSPIFVFFLLIGTQPNLFIHGHRFTVEADRFIKDLTIITEYTGDVDYLKNREHDDGDSMMTLLSATNPSKSLVICPDKRSNIARFINGINNHTPDGRKKQNLKCVRFNVNGECRVLLIANRDISKGERLYYDYNGYEHEYPTEHFV